MNIKDLIISAGPTLGYLLIWLIVFSESGLVIGLFLPGDSLLMTAGILASQNFLDIRVLLFGCVAGAILGDNVGYFTGYRWGRKLFENKDARFFKKEYLIAAQDFYEKHGKMAIVIARFVPVVRTFAPIVAGISAMRYRTFMFYNICGGSLWTFGMLLFGYFIGKKIPPDQIDHYLLPLIALVVIISGLPSVIHILKERKSKKS